jgi:hypothetical protein
MFRWVESIKDFPDAEVVENNRYRCMILEESNKERYIESHKYIMDFFNNNDEIRTFKDNQPIRILIDLIKQASNSKLKQITVRIMDDKEFLCRIKRAIKTNQYNLSSSINDNQKNALVGFRLIYDDHLGNKERKTIYWKKFKNNLTTYGYINFFDDPALYIDPSLYRTINFTITKIKYNMNSKTSIKDCTIHEYHQDIGGIGCQYMGFFNRPTLMGTELWKGQRQSLLILNMQPTREITKHEYQYTQIDKNTLLEIVSVPYQKSKNIYTEQDDSQLVTRLNIISNTVPDECVLISNTPIEFYLIHLVEYDTKYNKIPNFFINIMQLIYYNFKRNDYELKSSFNFLVELYNDPMRKKYLKYKMKYLELKMKNINL